MDVAVEAMRVWKKGVPGSANCVITRCDSPIANFPCIVTTLNPSHIILLYNMVLGV